MSEGFNRNTFGLIFAVIVLACLEGVSVFRWLVFDGAEPSVHQLLENAGILLIIWFLGWVGDWFAQRARREKEIYSRIRDIDTRLDAIYRWGSVPQTFQSEPDETWLDNDNELDELAKGSVDRYKAEAMRGEAWQQYNLAVAYSNLHTTSGYRKAAYWYNKALLQGNDCESSLADTYNRLKEYDKAMHWYRKVVQRGGSSVFLVEHRIGEMYAEGQGVARNYAEAARWWLQAAEHGWQSSRYSLGKLYAEGADGFEQNPNEAFFHLHIASTAKDYPNPYAADLREAAAKKLRPYRLTRERERAEEWLASRYSNPPSPLPVSSGATATIRPRRIPTVAVMVVLIAVVAYVVVSGIANRDSHFVTGPEASKATISQVAITGSLPGEVVLNGSNERPDERYEFRGSIHNNSNETISFIRMRIRIFECPKDAANDDPLPESEELNCQKMGDATREVFLTAAPGETIGFGNFYFPEHPKNCRWSYNVLKMETLRSAT